MAKVDISAMDELLKGVVLEWLYATVHEAFEKAYGIDRNPEAKRFLDRF